MGPSRALRWALAGLVVVGLAVVVAALYTRRGEEPSLAASTRTGVAEDDSTLVERGRYLAVAANCFSCHTRPGGDPLSGGVSFETPFGTLYSSNITSDVKYGIGGWTYEDLRRALHEGISAKGYRLFPAFPYTSFTKMRDPDVRAIYAYLRTVSPQPYSPPANAVLFTQRWVMGLWNELFFRPGRFKEDGAQSVEWNTGAYLVEALGHCSACHSPRNAFMAEIQAKAYQGGSIWGPVVAGKSRSWSAVDLTGSHAGLKAWSVDNLVKYLHGGFSPRAGTFGPMNEVIADSTSKLSMEDVQAMAVYIKSLPDRQTAASRLKAGPAPAASKSDAVSKGEAIYHEHCEKCHGGSGRGGMFSGPPLAGSAVVQASDPSSVLNTILYGAEPPRGFALGAWETMHPYADVLDDSQVATLVSFLRGAWGNSAALVDAAAVARQR